jgi:hypothetical protein
MTVRKLEVKQMTQEELVKVLDAKFPRCEEITEETREQTKKESSRYRGGVRLSNGRFWTTKEYEAFRKKTLNKSLP